MLREGSMARGGERGERHPNAAELERFLLGEMSPRQAAPIISHLLSGCPQCREGMAPLASVVFAAGPLAPETVPSADSEYDFPMFKAFAAARQYASNLTREKEVGHPGDDNPLPKRPSTLEVLASQGQKRTARDRYEILFEHCRNLRYSDPEGMILSASLALTLAERETATQGESPELADLEARAWAELGNAHRVANDLTMAEAALGHAMARSSQGTSDPLILARIMELTASLYTDQRRFKEAHRLLDCVYTVYHQAGEAQAAARTFISKGIASNYSLEPEEAIGFLVEGIRQIDSAHDPKLVLAAVHGLLWCLVDSGLAADAGRLLSGASPLYEVHGEEFDQLRRLWLEGRIASQLGEDARAEQALDQVREGFKTADLAYDVALVSLDLAALWLRQGRTLEIKELIDEMITIFRARSIQREALGALLMLKKAFETDQATAALLRTVTTELWRAERSPVRRTGLSS
jgi:tetratricopeptide (TPR) repeat protein